MKQMPNRRDSLAPAIPRGRPRELMNSIGTLLSLLIATTPLAGCLDVWPSGVVHEIRSQQPVGGATVELDCLKYQLHGTTLIRTVSRESGSDGKYRFEISDVYDCDVILYHVRKTGYMDAAQIPDSLIQVPFVESGQVPRYVYLARMDDVPRLQLEGLLQQSQARLLENSVPKGSEAFAHADEYGALAAALSRSRKLLTTPEEAVWVRSQYCARLQKSWAALSGDERVLASKYDSVDSRDELEAFCAQSSGQKS
jgi:hypothetical protein